MEAEIIEGMREVARAFGVRVDSVRVDFAFSERQSHPDDNGAWWTVTVFRAPVGRRRLQDKTSSNGETFAEAVAEIIKSKPIADKIEGRS